MRLQKRLKKKKKKALNEAPCSKLQKESLKTKQHLKGKHYLTAKPDG